MLPQTSTSIALEGIGFTDSTLIAILGFSVYTVEVIIPNPVSPELLGGGFGTRNTKPYVSKKPSKTEKQTTRPVIVKLTLNGKTTTRTYMVRPNKFRMIVQIANIVNSLTSSMSVGISNIKRTATSLVKVFFDK